MRIEWPSSDPDAHLPTTYYELFNCPFLFIYSPRAGGIVENSLKVDLNNIVTLTI